MSHPTSKLIMLPSSTEDMYNKASEYELKFGSPQVFGCINATLIASKMSTKFADDFFSDKQVHSMNLEVVCD